MSITTASTNAFNSLTSSSSSSSSSSQFLHQLSSKDQMRHSSIIRCNNDHSNLTRPPKRSESSYHTTWMKKKALRTVGHDNSTDSGVVNDTDNAARNQYSSFILDGFQALKSNRILCDVTLIAQGRVFSNFSSYL